MSCFSKQILDYFYNIQNTGRILKPEAIGRAGSKQEGTVIEFSWRVKDAVIVDARFRTFGDVNAIAISSVLTSMMIGKSISDVLNISAEDILEHLQDNKPNYLYLTDLALSALANTYENYIKKFTKANPEMAQTSEFAETLRENLAKIQKGESVVEEELDLSSVGNIEESVDEESYLRNLSNYERTVEENSIEKSLKNLLYGYTSVDNGEVKKKEFEVDAEKPKRGRGRPRKERSDEELDVAISQISRGRGRPRKERTAEELEAEKNKVSRGRGRPRKERTPEELEAENNKVKRGRGRPRKEPSIETENEVSSIKRGRGRPKKEVADDSRKEMEEVTYESEIDENVESNLYNSPYFNNLKEDVTPEVYAEEEPEELDTEVVGSKVDDADENITLAQSRGRGRPRKERTAEELEAEKNKVSRGRGRPRKERTPEEIEAENNKVKRGRGRPRKDGNSVFGIVKLRDDATSETSVPGVVNVKNSFETDLIETPVRGRGRPKKERTPEEIEAEKNKISRGRGRPRKENNVQAETVEENTTAGVDIIEEQPINSTEFVEEKPANDASNVEVESQTLLGAFENDFAPKQNKYGVGMKTTTYYATQTKTLRIEKTNHSKTDERTTGSVIRKYNLDETNNKTIEHKIIGEDADEFLSQPLSDDVNNILKNGGSIEDALKALMESDD